jgi:hypothetical protein
MILACSCWIYPLLGVVAVIFAVAFFMTWRHRRRAGRPS